MEAKHTPGPWFNNGTDIFSTAGGYPAVIAETDVPQDEPKPSYGEKQANARLIAAAPELLEALETLAAYGDVFAYRIGGGNPYVKALAAIAKAKGL